MIQLQSRLTVADNSGARQVQCIRILNKGKSKTARPGDLITVAVKQARPHKKIQKKDVCVGIVVRTCKEVVRNNGFKLGFGDNACILVNSKTDKTPVGTRSVRSPHGRNRGGIRCGIADGIATALSERTRTSYMRISNTSRFNQPPPPPSVCCYDS